MKNNSNRILLIFTRLPFPASGGRESMLFQLLLHIQDYYEIDFYYFEGNDDKDIEEIKLEFEKLKLNLNRVTSLSFPNKVEVIKNIVLRTKSLNESVFFSKKNQLLINETINNGQYKFVYCDMIRTAQYLEDVDSVNKIVDMDDLLSLRYSRFFKQSNKDFNLFGTFSFLNNRIATFITKIFIKPILRYEVDKLAIRESKIVDSFDKVAFVSPKEANEMEKKHNKVIYALPPVIDTSKFQVRKANKKSDSLSFLFVGNLKTNQNFQSLTHIIKNILPKLADQGIKFHFDVVGAYDDRMFQYLSYTYITFHGFVDNLNAFYDASDFLLAPISFGTGIKLKIAEAIAFGVPVITNTVGAEGLGLVQDLSAVIEEHDEKMIEKIIFYCTNLEKAQDLAKRAKIETDSFFSVIALKESYSNFFGNLDD